MREDLYSLLKLQDVDNEVDELRRHKKDYPARIEELQALIDETDEAKEDQQQRLADLEKAARNLQGQLEKTREDLAAHQQRLSQTSNTREYDAVQQEIAALKKSIDECEMGLLKGDEENDDVRRAIEESDSDVEDKSKEHEAEIADLKVKMAAIDSEIEKTLVRREADAEELPRRLKMAYERVRRGKLLATVRVTRGACGGCWKNLSPQQVNELRRSDRLSVCESCGRILVWDDRTETTD
jgi:uncharacterized protein